MSSSDSEVIDNGADFGSALAAARKTQNYSVDDICEHLKIPVHVIEAIESSNIEALPAATFTQGYIRAYAKFLELSETSALEAYNRARPHSEVTELKSSATAKSEASSQSPLFKTITLLLMAAGIAALIFGGVQYYQEKVDDIGVELESKQPSFTGNSLDSPGQNQLAIKQNAHITNDDTLIVGASTTLVTPAEENIEYSEEIEIDEPAELQVPVANDVLEIFAEKGAWMQVRDASDARLFYNMVPVGGNKKLIGEAPFRISLGNANSTQILLNGIEVDVRSNIRPNNTAIFTVSTKDEVIVFH